MPENAATGGRPLRLAVVGCGMLFERYYLPALAQCSTWRLVAACDTRSTRREWVQRTHPELVVCDGLSALSHAGSLDAVFIATPPDTHCQLTTAALAAGLHVLVEKPMALNTTEARAMLAASQRTGRQLWVGFTRRFGTAYRTLRAKLASTRTSDLTALACHFCFAPWGPISGYLRDDSRGGGVLHDVVSHQVDLLPWLIGEPIAAVRLTTGYRSDRVTYDLRLHGGLVVQCLAEHGRRYREHVEVTLPASRLIAYPSGLLASRRLPFPCLRVYARGLSLRDRVAHRLFRHPNATIESFAAQFRAVAAALRGDDVFPQAADAQHGLASMLAMEACQQGAARPGRWVSVGR